MCTDTTKQEIAFLIALNSRSGLSRLETARDLPRILAKLTWPVFLADEPSSIDALFSESINRGTIERSAPFAWRSSKIGQERLFDLIERFAPEDEKDKLRKAANIFA